MRKGIIQLNKFATKENTVESYVCFKKFIEFLEDKIEYDTSIRVHFYRFVLDKLHQYPELANGIPMTAASQYDEVLELVSCIVLPLVEDENEAMVALTNGIAPDAFYSTNAFFQLFKPSADGHAPQSWIDEEMALKAHMQVQYDIILQKIYRRHLPDRVEMVRSFFDESTGLYKYYRINIDARFLEVKYKVGCAAPAGNDIDGCFECEDSFSAIEQVVKLDNFIATGFCIVHLTDVTARQALDQLSKVVINIDKENVQHDFVHVTRLLQTITGSNEYQFGIMPFFTINNRAALLYESFPYSILVKASADAGIPKKIFSRYINHYTSKPGWIEYEKGNSSQLAVKLQQALDSSGIHFYGLAPVYFNDVLVGILEAGAPAGVLPLDEMQFRKLVPAMPYISQLLKRSIEKFNVSIDKIVKDRFTVIQPSVEWKFNEAAWHYFRSHDIEHKDTPFDKIFFKEVYPLYGAVDIRNSTNERNRALREDLNFHLTILTALLKKLSANGYEKNTLPLINTSRSWLEKITAYISIEEEWQLTSFLFGEVNSLLDSLKSSLPDFLLQEVAVYNAVIDEENGDAFKSRRQLENSLQTINRAVGKYFDLFNEELQTIYPCYFEKFRTDGIEYDIYIGQSIAPGIPFSHHYLKRLRLWQVQSMAAIAKLTYSLIPQLEHPLQTTQLIFVNARSIDISFRDDEKHFDVEGGYNIRYQIIKKRIDKVTIRHSNQRLTQFGKIAIVYFNDQDAAEYAGYIHELQQQQVLLDDLEYLELQELQGVTGLKALRVGVA